MLNGETAGIQCRQFTGGTGSLLPADLEGQRIPPAGTHEYFIGLSPPDGLILFRFHVDFTHPELSTVTNALKIPVKTYSAACAELNGNQCAIQPFTTNKLNIVTGRLMPRLVYRQFDGYGSIVANHSVRGPFPRYAPAIRWYELRTSDDPTVIPTVHQQATLAPDSKNRHTGGIAINRLGHIALGYTVISSLVYPSMEFAARSDNDPLNTLETQVLFTGRASQINDIHSWSRYSLMSVDPADDCTFWYSNEYLKTMGSYNWSTFITWFRLTGCS